MHCRPSTIHGLHPWTPLGDCGLQTYDLPTRGKIILQAPMQPASRILIYKLTHSS